MTAAMHRQPQQPLLSMILRHPHKDKIMFSNTYSFFITFLIDILPIHLVSTVAQASSKDYNCCKFGLVFQNVKNYNIDSQRLWFCWGGPVSQLAQHNPQGDYFTTYNLVRAVPKVNKYDSNEAYRDDWEYFLRRISEPFARNTKSSLMWAVAICPPSPA